MGEISYLPVSENYTVEQALSSAMQADMLEDVLIIGWLEDGSLYVRSSHMSRKDALWLVEQARIRTLDISNYQDDQG